MSGSLLVTPDPPLIGIILAMCVVISVSAQAIVVCRASVDCNGESGDDLGETTVRGCCVDNPNGLAYSVQGGANESCTPCIGEYMAGPQCPYLPKAIIVANKIVL